MYDRFRHNRHRKQKSILLRARGFAWEIQGSIGV
jgi:hypothetical protein